MIQLLGALVDKSIVTVSFPSPDARYDMLDTVRDYALERLAEGGGLSTAQKAHAEYYAALADAARAELRGPDWQACVRRLELEHDNLWAALAYARAAPDPGIAIRLGGLGWYFTLAERVSDGRRFVELALAAASEDAPVALRLELVAFLCYLATEELDVDAAIEAGERALAATESRRRSRLSSRRRSRSPSQNPVTVGGPPCWRRRRTLASKRPRTTGASRRSASCGPWSPLPPETCPQSPPWRRRRTVTPTRSGSTRFKSPRCCSRPGSPSGGVRERRGGGVSARVRARGPCRVCRPRCLRAGRARLERICERRPAQGRRPRAPGARRRGGGTVAVDRGARARPASPRPGRRGRRRHRRGAAPRRARVVRQAPAARSSREPVPGARGRPGRGRPGRPRRPRAAPPRDCDRVGARRDCSDVVAPLVREGSLLVRLPGGWQRGRGPWQGVGSGLRDACR